MSKQFSAGDRLGYYAPPEAGPWQLGNVSSRYSSTVLVLISQSHCSVLKRQRKPMRTYVLLTSRVPAGAKWEAGQHGEPSWKGSECLTCSRKNWGYTPCRDTVLRQSSHRMCNPGRSYQRKRRSEELWAVRLASLKWAPERKINRTRGIQQWLTRTQWRNESQSPCPTQGHLLTLYAWKYPRYLMTPTQTKSVDVPSKMLHRS